MTLTSPVTTAALSGAELSAGYAAGAFSPSDAARDIIELVEARNPELNAFTEFSAERVLRDAEASSRRWEAGEQIGAFDGVPCTVKENLHRAGVQYRSGTAGSEEYVPRANAPIVDRIIEAGGVIVGSTTMPDWGMLSSGVSSLHGITRSPWDASLTAGGSSAGAGVAAAAGFGVVHFGTDIGGSVRLPATWLGLASLKPSAGRIPLDVPYMGRAAGPLARSVRDVALGMSIATAPDTRDYSALEPRSFDWDMLDCEVSGLRVAVHTDAGAGMPVDPEVAAAVDQVAEHFARAGAEVQRIDPFVTEQMLEDLDLFWRVRSWATFAQLPAARKQKVLPFIADWCSAGADIAGSRVLECIDTIQEMRRATVAATTPFDIVLSPVATRAAFPAEWPMPFGETNGGMTHIGFTLPYNMSEQPAATVNCGFTEDGRTIGVQLAGRRFDDLGVLQAAAWYERTRDQSAVPVFPIRGA